MHFFSQFFNEKNFNTLPRKNSISASKTLIYGPPKSGKTSLALDFANNSGISPKKIVYFDCNDFRLSLDEAKTELLKLYLEKKIELLIIDSYRASISLPHLEKILLISNENYLPPSFHIHYCDYLNFVEYVSFNQKNLSIDSLLKNFIKDGNLPELLSLGDHQKLKYKQEMLLPILQDNFSLFQKIIPFQAQKITFHQFYTLIKKEQKISKDKIYNFFHTLEMQRIIFFIPHIQTNKPKKLYFFDFSLPKTFSLRHTILPILENMFILELLESNALISYDDNQCFIVNEKKIFFAPFADKDFIEQRLSKLTLTTQNELILFITLNFSGIGNYNGFKWESMRFVEFVLSKE